MCTSLKKQQTYGIQICQHQITVLDKCVHTSFKDVWGSYNFLSVVEDPCPFYKFLAVHGDPLPPYYYGNESSKTQTNLCDIYSIL